jgi:uncharacterized protein YxjI
MYGINLENMKSILVHQVHELGEWFGFETRNKYEIFDENKKSIGFAAEQNKGFLGFLARQFLGHWRSFEIHFFSSQRQLAFIAHHPFRWYFQRLEVKSTDGKKLGAIQKRFSIFTKRFDIENAKGLVVMEVASPIWKLWTFNFMHAGKAMASVKKKWSGLLAEGFTDKDNFLVEYSSPTLTEEEKIVILASAVYVDLLYFEKKQ